jgi:hypothetical protein
VPPGSSRSADSSPPGSVRTGPPSRAA